MLPLRKCLMKEWIKEWGMVWILDLGKLFKIYEFHSYFLTHEMSLYEEETNV